MPPAGDKVHPTTIVSTVSTDTSQQGSTTRWTYSKSQVSDGQYNTTDGSSTFNFTIPVSVPLWVETRSALVGSANGVLHDSVTGTILPRTINPVGGVTLNELTLLVSLVFRNFCHQVWVGELWRAAQQHFRGLQAWPFRIHRRNCNLYR